MNPDAELEEYELDRLYRMRLHETKRISHGVHVTRVPGGWIYEICDTPGLSSTFVPEPEPEPETPHIGPETK